MFSLLADNIRKFSLAQFMAHAEVIVSPKKRKLQQVLHQQIGEKLAMHRRCKRNQIIKISNVNRQIAVIMTVNFIGKYFGFSHHTRLG